jgi:Cu-Zn family superoxide dismutase
MTTSFPRRALLAAALACGMTFSFAGCASTGAHADSSAAEAVAVITPTKGNATAGTVHFKQLEGGKIQVNVALTGLTPGLHAMHVHEYGDITSADGTSAGGHYNPEGHQHGAPMAEMRHAGDFGNITADDKGVANVELTFTDVTIAGHHNPIAGHALVIHAKTDDFTQPVGNAGARVGVGVIGISKPAGK